MSFSRDIRPVLSDHCFQCHGPDEKKREADLRLDIEQDAKRVTDGRAAIVPGDPARSELWRRVTTDHADERMPPAETGRSLTAAQIQALRRWIEEGAVWEQHWSFVAPQTPPLPAVRDAEWLRTPVDAFVVQQLERRGLSPQPEADRERLIRRVTIGLTGLPPTPAEMAEFLADRAPGAYERLVERLLASPRYGERMAWTWLDGARYADTSGYQNDGPRFMWRWRDWVIDAYNRNQPFDQFTVEQLAGDLLPHATLDQRIATGFNRNHRGNSEGGIIPEEYQVEYVVDRVDTTFTVWLGLTMGCTRCHDHKYDPLTQREFYRVFAYFNNIPEYGRAIKEGNSPPLITAPTDEQSRQLAVLDRQLAAAEERWSALQSTLAEQQQAWESSQPSDPPTISLTQHGLARVFDFDAPVWPAAAAPAAGARGGGTGDQPPSAASPPSVRVAGGEPAFREGRLGKAIELDGRTCVEIADAGDYGYFDRFSATVWVRPHKLAAGTILSRMTDDEQGDGWYVQLRDGHLQVNLVKRWLDDSLRVETVDTIPADQWTHVALTYDGSRTARGTRVYINGRLAAVHVKLDLLNQTFSVKEPLRIGGGNGPAGRFAGQLDEVRLYARTLPAQEVAILATADSIPDIIRVPAAQRTDGQKAKLEAAFLATAATDTLHGAADKLSRLREARQAFVETLPTVMVMQEMPQPRETFVLRRGEYDKRGDRVLPGLPACLPPLSPDAPHNRLTLARWLVTPEHPLTARVAVNRIWQLHFGQGLVRSTEDFGVQGEPPTHPELLDWLAVEFVRSGWDVKHLHRLIVGSATYRQSSKAGPVQLAKDPDNRWLSRGPRFRMSAEMIRDQALAVSGLLSERLGGPSVKPYQPADLWKDLATDTAYVQDHGANLYRRSLYTYWKRTVAPPAMMTFDAAGREACQVRPMRTNTPLQALTLLNDVTYVEAARVLAQRVLTEGGPEPADRLTLAFRLCTARSPSASELSILLAAWQDHLARFERDRTAAEQLVAVGEFPRDERYSTSELAACTTIASLLLNLDEVITR